MALLAGECRAVPCLVPRASCAVRATQHSAHSGLFLPLPYIPYALRRGCVPVSSKTKRKIIDVNETRTVFYRACYRGSRAPKGSAKAKRKHGIENVPCAVASSSLGSLPLAVWRGSVLGAVIPPRPRTPALPGRPDVLLLPVHTFAFLSSSSNPGVLLFATPLRAHTR